MACIAKACQVAAPKVMPDAANIGAFFTPDTGFYGIVFIKIHAREERLAIGIYRKGAGLAA